jgi:hypothetical protein
MSGGHGGRRSGAGRPPGTGWRPAVAAMRTTAAERLTTIVGGSRDPLEICLDIAANGGEDTQIRLQACAIALPFLYPRLSATQVDARHTTVNVDAGQLLDRLDERIAKLQSAPAPQLIEAQADGADGVGAGDEVSADDPKAE